MAANTTALRTPRGCPYAIHEGPYLSSQYYGPTTAKVVYRVFVGDMFAFIEELMPKARQPDPKSPRIVKDPTWKLPNFRTTGKQRFLSPESCTADPFPDQKPIDPWLADATPTAHGTRSLDAGSVTVNIANNAAYSPYVLVTVNYATNIDSLYTAPRTNLKPELFLEPTFSATVELLAVHPNSKTKAVDRQVSTSQNLTGGEQITELAAPCVKLIPIVERTFRWTWAVNPDFTKIFSMLGGVNASEYVWLPGAKVETVMFTGLSGKLDWRLGPNGDSVVSPWTLEYRFAQRQITEAEKVYGWNHIYNPDSQKFEALKREQTGGTLAELYSRVDFNQLFYAAVPTAGD